MTYNYFKNTEKDEIILWFEILQKQIVYKKDIFSNKKFTMNYSSSIFRLYNNNNICIQIKTDGIENKWESIPYLNMLYLKELNKIYYIQNTIYKNI